MAKNNYYNADGDGFVADLKALEVYSQTPLGTNREQSFVSNPEVVDALQLDSVVVEVGSDAYEVTQIMKIGNNSLVTIANIVDTKTISGQGLSDLIIAVGGTAETYLGTAYEGNNSGGGAISQTAEQLAAAENVAELIWEQSGRDCSIIDLPITLPSVGVSSQSRAAPQDIGQVMMSMGFEDVAAIQFNLGIPSFEALSQFVLQYIIEEHCRDNDGGVEPVEPVEPSEPDEVVYGCMNPDYDNYNPLATEQLADSCRSYDLDTNPTGNADNSDLISGLAALDGDYGDLIDDTILLIQNLQTAYEEAVANGGDVDALQTQLDAANEQLNSILGTDGLLQTISNAVSSAEDGTHDPSVLNAVSSQLLDAPNGQSGSSYIDAINNALATISSYANSTSNYDEISSELEAAQDSLQEAQQEIDNLLNGLNTDGSYGGSYSEQLDDLNAILEAIEGALSTLTATPPTGGTAPTQSGDAQTDVALLVNSYNTLVSTYNDLEAQQEGLEAISEESMTTAEYEQALQGAADAAIQALEDAGIPVTQAELDTYIANYIAENNLVTETDVMLTTTQFDQAVSQALTQYISENGLLTPEAAEELADAAVTIALEDMILDTGQADTITGLQSQLVELNTQIVSLQAELATSQSGSGATSEQLDAAYALLDDMEAAAEAQFQTYQDDIAAYEAFLANLSTSMSRLEAFLSDNYGYQAGENSASTIPTAINIPSGLAANNDFMTQQYVPQFAGGSMPNVYMNFAGKTIGVSRGFKQFKGKPMKRKMLNVTGKETTFELNDSTKKILWGAGIVILSLGAFKLIKSK
jgi:hypothetical protein